MPSARSFNNTFMQVASVAGNLITGETITFVSLHVAGNIYETAQMPVRNKQQTIEYNTDFSIPIDEECLTIRTPPEDGSSTTSAQICVIVRLNRKGVIDSEVIASGKLMVPLGSSPTESVSVGLFEADESTTEIAIAKLAIEVSIDTDGKGVIANIISEMEELMIRHARGTASGTVVRDSLELFLTSVTPVRRMVDKFTDLLTWKTSYVQSWLFLLTVMTMYPVGLLAAVTVVICNAVGIPLPFLTYLSRVVMIPPQDIPTDAATAELLIEQNVLFLARWVDHASRFADTVSRRTKSEWIVLGLCILHFLSARWIILCVMMAHSFPIQAVFVYASRRYFAPPVRSSNRSSDGEVVVHENQRWWLGTWSEKLIGSEAFPWTTDGGAPSKPREIVQPPQGSEWASGWSFDTSVPDPDGWVYGRDFRQPPTNLKRDIGDFVRTRKWVRNFRRIGDASQ